MLTQVYGHTTTRTAMDNIEYTPPSPLYATASAANETPRRGTLGAGEIVEALSSPERAKTFVNRVSNLVKANPPTKERVSVRIVFWCRSCTVGVSVCGKVSGSRWCAVESGREEGAVGCLRKGFVLRWRR